MKSILSLDDFLKQSEIQPITNEEEMEGAEMSPETDVETEETEVEMIEEPSEETESEEKKEEEDEEIEDAGEMAFGQLERCIDYSKMLRKRIQPGEDIEPWIAAKITKAMDYLQSVYNYLDGQDGEEEEIEEGEM